MTIEASIAGKWLAMLKEIAADRARVVFLGNPKTSSFDYFMLGGSFGPFACDRACAWSD